MDSGNASIPDAGVTTPREPIECGWQLDPVAGVTQASSCAERIAAELTVAASKPAQPPPPPVAPVKAAAPAKAKSRAVHVARPPPAKAQPKPREQPPVLRDGQRWTPSPEDFPVLTQEPKATEPPAPRDLEDLTVKALEYQLRKNEGRQR